MPRRLPVRPAKLIGNLFVIFVLMVIALIYYVYVGIVWGPRSRGNIVLVIIMMDIDNNYVSILLVFFHLIFVLMLWSFF